MGQSGKAEHFNDEMLSVSANNNADALTIMAHRVLARAHVKRACPEEWQLVRDILGLTPGSADTRQLYYGKMDLDKEAGRETA